MENPAARAQPDPATHQFAETRWSVVLRAGNSAEPGAAAALESLCRNYWYPVYAWIRRCGHGPDDAMDLTQEFIATLLKRDSLSTVDPAKGRFRTFLIRSIHNFLTDRHRIDSAIRRGGGQPVIALDALEPEQLYALLPASHDTPDAAFDRGWTQLLLTRAFERLEKEQADAGRAPVFAELGKFVSSPPDAGEYRASASALGISENALGVTVHRMRLRCRELIMEEIMQTVGNRAEAEQELRALFGR